MGERYSPNSSPTSAKAKPNTATTAIRRTHTLGIRGDGVLALDQPQPAIQRRDEDTRDAHHQADDHVGVDHGQHDELRVHGCAQRRGQHGVANRGKHGDRHHVQRQGGQHEGQGAGPCARGG